MQNDSIITELAEQLLRYNADTGKVTWKVDRGSRGRIKAGARAGSIRTDGYREIRFGKRPVMEHRVAWFLHYRELPPNQLDHINRVRDDNRISNLRVAQENTHDNNQNRRISKNNTSGHTGVLWCARLNKWLARLKVKGHSMYLGSYSVFEEAVAARKAAELKYFKFANS